MKEGEFKKLLDRGKNIADAKQCFSDYIELLIDIVDYGNWLLPRAYDSSNKKLVDAIVIGVLLKQVIAMTDSVAILISNGTAYPASLSIRTALEASLYLDWILKGDSEKKVNYYYVSNLRDYRLWALRIIKGTPEEQKFSNDIQDLTTYFENFNKPDIQEMTKKQLSAVERILDLGNFKIINLELEELYKKLKRELNWYHTLVKPPNLKQISKEVGRYPEYGFIYSSGSKTTHTSDDGDHIHFSINNTKNTKVIFEPIRSLKEIDSTICYGAGIAIETYMSIIKYYRKGELSNFVQKYKNDWQRTYLSVTNVENKSE